MSDAKPMASREERELPETGERQRLVRATTPALEAGIETEAKLERKGVGLWKVRVTGLHAGAFCSAIVLFTVLAWLDPLKNAQHFVLALVAAFVAGMFVSAVVVSGRLRDAMARGNELRDELHRVAAEKSDLEKLLYPERQSSLSRRATKSKARK